MTKSEAHRALVRLDGERARLMYAGVTDALIDNDRAWARHQDRVRATPEYREIQRQMDEASAVTRGELSPSLRRNLRNAGL
jgi:hypothetical protein